MKNFTEKLCRILPEEQVHENEPMSRRTTFRAGGAADWLVSSESLYGYWEEIPDDLKGKVVFKCDTAEEYLNAFNKIDEKPICKKNEELITLYDRLYSENAAYNIMKDIVEKTTGVKL